MAVDKMVSQLGLPNGVKHDARHTPSVSQIKLISINPTSVPTISLPALPTPAISEGSLTPNV
jgi:hypothetical protein